MTRPRLSPDAEHPAAAARGRCFAVRIVCPVRDERGYRVRYINADTRLQAEALCEHHRNSGSLTSIRRVRAAERDAIADELWHGYEPALDLTAQPEDR